MFSFTGDSSFELLKLRGGFGPVAIICVTCAPGHRPVSATPTYDANCCRLHARRYTLRPEVLADAEVFLLPCRAWPLATCGKIPIQMGGIRIRGHTNITKGGSNSA